MQQMGDGSLGIYASFAQPLGGADWFRDAERLVGYDPFDHGQVVRALVGDEDGLSGDWQGAIREAVRALDPGRFAPRSVLMPPWYLHPVGTAVVYAYFWGRWLVFGH